jgi:hypothetical protein
VPAPGSARAEKPAGRCGGGRLTGLFADVVAIDPFSGDQFEGFESIQPAGPYMGQMPIFSGAATFDDEFTDPWITFSLSGPGGDLTP